MNMEGKHKCTPPACEYDRKVEEKGWRGPDIIFGLSFGYVKPGETVLDIGIGTGLGSFLFHKAGLRVFGMDLSQDMLTACSEKGFAEELRRHDLLLAPYPFATGSMDHVISVGVLNHFSNLDVVFSEAARILREEGTFGFMVLDRSLEEPSEYVLDIHPGVPGSAVTLYRHSRKDIEAWVKQDFPILKSVEFTVYLQPGRRHAVPAAAYLVKRG